MTGASCAAVHHAGQHDADEGGGQGELGEPEQGNRLPADRDRHADRIGCRGDTRGGDRGDDAGDRTVAVQLTARTGLGLGAGGGCGPGQRGCGHWGLLSFGGPDARFSTGATNDRAARGQVDERERALVAYLALEIVKGG